LGKSPLVTAIRYALTCIERLPTDLDHSSQELDNIAVELGMRVIALGSKNHLFAGTDASGKATTTAYTLIETAKLNAVDPHTLLADAIAHIPDQEITKFDELLSWRWNE
jgi:transposase